MGALRVPYWKLGFHHKVYSRSSYSRLLFSHDPTEHCTPTPILLYRPASGSRESPPLQPVKMAGPEVHHLFHHPIADHSFSADRQTLAVARDNLVELFQRSGNKYVSHDELKGHDKTVTGVDIAPSSGRIVTCSQGWLLPSGFSCHPEPNALNMQIATRTCGNLRRLVGSLPLSCCVSIVLLPLSAGHRRRRSLLWDLGRE